MVVVVPFRAGGKTRLRPDLRRDLALAMLEDVLVAATALGAVRAVTSDVDAAELATRLGASVVADPGGGQGPAVAAGLAGAGEPCLVVNADLPLATPSALRRLAAARAALVAAADGTTNALSLPDATSFRPLYGPGSASRFAAQGLEPLAVPELEHDVDTIDDLRALARLALPVGRRTTLVLNQHKVLAAR